MSLKELIDVNIANGNQELADLLIELLERRKQVADLTNLITTVNNLKEEVKALKNTESMLGGMGVGAMQVASFGDKVTMESSYDEDVSDDLQSSADLYSSMEADDIDDSFF